MKQLYSITRTAFYKKLLKNKKGWKIKRIQYTMQGLAYSYGFDAVKGYETIQVEPNVSLLDRTTFTISYENLEDRSQDWHKCHITFAQMQMEVHKIIYSQNPVDHVRNMRQKRVESFS